MRTIGFNGFKIKRVLDVSELERRQDCTWPAVLKRLDGDRRLRSNKALELEIERSRFNTLRTALSVARRVNNKHKDLKCVSRKGKFYVKRVKATA